MLAQHCYTILNLRQPTNLKITPLYLYEKLCYSLVATLSDVCCFHFHHNSKRFLNGKFVLCLPEDKNCFLSKTTLQQSKEQKAVGGKLLMKRTDPTNWMPLKDWIVSWLFIDSKEKKKINIAMNIFSSKNAVKKISATGQKEKQECGTVCLLLWQGGGCAPQLVCEPLLVVTVQPRGIGALFTKSAHIIFHSHKQYLYWKKLLTYFIASRCFRVACLLSDYVWVLIIMYIISIE